MFGFLGPSPNPGDDIQQEQNGGGDEEPSEEELSLFQDLCEYGVHNDVNSVPLLRQKFLDATKTLSEGARNRLLLHVIRLVEERTLSINALNPFLFLDPSESIASTAALHAADMWPGSEADPLAGVRALRAAARAHAEEGGDVRNSLAILCGLLVLGDRRALRELHGCWRDYSPEARVDLSLAQGPVLHAPFADFLLDWLEDSEGAEFGKVARALAEFGNRAKTESVWEVSRAMPVWTAQNGEVIKRLRQWTFEEFSERIRDRLLQIAADEPAPRIMHKVLEDWGIKRTR